jgi:hypothetical protein
MISVHVPSERASGEARRTILKARAAKIPRSVSEVFAFSTIRTISDEDTAAGNVWKRKTGYILICLLSLLSFLSLLSVLSLHI